MLHRPTSLRPCGWPALRGCAICPSGLPELNEATQTVICFGDAETDAAHPESSSSVNGWARCRRTRRWCLCSAICTRSKRLRLRPDPAQKHAQSGFAHRDAPSAAICCTGWRCWHSRGQPTGAGRAGTYREVEAQWRPDFAIRVIEAAMWAIRRRMRWPGLLKMRPTRRPILPALTKLLTRLFWPNCRM